MSKEQINYLLALATLAVVWLYFNTFFVAARINSLGRSMGGVITAPPQRFPNPMGMQNMQPPPGMAELIKNQARALQAPVVPGTVPSASPEIPQDQTR
jgi:hypothetical protein